MKVCVTGTRFGMKKPQLESFRRELLRLAPTVFRHGSCSGADDEAAQFADTLTSPRPYIVSHPGPDGEWKAKFSNNDEVLPEKNHFARNRDMVDLSDVVIACPLHMTWDGRGGTEYTYRYALKKGKRVIVILPDGEVQDSEVDL